jgi:hypothetical protein
MIIPESTDEGINLKRGVTKYIDMITITPVNRPAKGVLTPDRDLIDDLEREPYVNDIIPVAG